MVGNYKRSEEEGDRTALDQDVVMETHNGPISKVVGLVRQNMVGDGRLCKSDCSQRKLPLLVRFHPLHQQAAVSSPYV